MGLLTLADEYQVDHLEGMCQVYIGEQTTDFYLNFFNSLYKIWPKDGNGHLNLYDVQLYMRGNTGGVVIGQTLTQNELVDKMMLYTHACIQFGLDKHKQKVMALLVALCGNAGSACKSKIYPTLTADVKAEIFEALSKKFSNC